MSFNHPLLQEIATASTRSDGSVDLGLVTDGVLELFPCQRVEFGNLPKLLEEELPSPANCEVMSQVTNSVVKIAKPDARTFRLLKLNGMYAHNSSVIGLDDKFFFIDYETEGASSPMFNPPEVKEVSKSNRQEFKSRLLSRLANLSPQPTDLVAMICCETSGIHLARTNEEANAILNIPNKTELLLPEDIAVASLLAMYKERVPAKLSDRGVAAFRLNRLAQIASQHFLTDMDIRAE